MLTGAHIITDGHKGNGKVCYSHMIRDFVLLYMMDAVKYGNGIVNVIQTVAFEKLCAGAENV